MRPIYITDPKRPSKKVSLARMMFLDYRYIQKELKEAEKVDNGYHERLRWLIIKGETRVPQAGCPYCETGTTTIFGYMIEGDGSLVVSPRLTSCMKGECKRKLKRKMEKAVKRGAYDPRFSRVLLMARNRKEAEKVGNILKHIYDLNSELTDEEVLEFFMDEEDKRKESPK